MLAIRFRLSNPSVGHYGRQGSEPRVSELPREWRARCATPAVAQTCDRPSNVRPEREQRPLERFADPSTCSIHCFKPLEPQPTDVPPPPRLATAPPWPGASATSGRRFQTGTWQLTPRSRSFRQQTPRLRPRGPMARTTANGWLALCRRVRLQSVVAPPAAVTTSLGHQTRPQCPQQQSSRLCGRSQVRAPAHPQGSHALSRTLLQPSPRRECTLRAPPGRQPRSDQSAGSTGCPAPGFATPWRLRPSRTGRSALQRRRPRFHCAPPASHGRQLTVPRALGGPSHCSDPWGCIALTGAAIWTRGSPDQPACGSSGTRPPSSRCHPYGPRHAHCALLPKQQAEAGLLDW